MAKRGVRKTKDQAPPEILDRFRILQESMGFLAALASGTEEALGPPARRVSYAAGKKLGKQFCRHAPVTLDLGQALVQVREVLSANHCLWNYEVFKPQQATQLITAVEGEQVLLVFRECMIRQSLFLFGHEQRGSLCNLMVGFFAGALEQVMGRSSSLEVLHAGENACLKRLVVQAGKRD